MTREESITKVNNTINAVKKHLLENNNVYAVWIIFSIGPLTLTTATNNYSLIGSSNSKVITNLLMSLEYCKNGSGQANSFTLDIAYTPDMLNVSKYKGDVNYIDLVLSSYRDCTIRYGYSVDGKQLLSPSYKGSILDFEVSIDSQILKYTIKGYSSIVSLTEAQQNYPRLCVEQSSNDTGDGGDGDKSNSSSSKSVAKAYNEDGTEDTSGTYASILNDTNAIDPIKLVKLVLENAVGEKTNYGYKIIVEDNAKASSLPEIKASSNTSVFEYVNNVLSLASDHETSNQSSKENTSGSKTNTKSNSSNPKDDSKTNNIEVADKIVFGYTISDKSDNKTITIYKYDPKDDKKTIDMIFEVCGKDTIVKSFETSFKGSVLSALVGTQSNNDSKDKPVNVDAEGNIISDNMNLLNITPIGDAKFDSLSEQTNWAVAVHHCYKATLTTLGIPCEIPINTKFNIVPTIYEQEHHTGGYYCCTKVTDNIDNQGFSTTMELMKLSAEEVKNYKSSLKNDADSSKLGIDIQLNPDNEDNKLNRSSQPIYDSPIGPLPVNLVLPSAIKKFFGISNK